MRAVRIDRQDLFYGFLGFIGGILSALFYNLVAGMVGGLELEVEGPPQKPTAAAPAVASY